MIKKIDHNGKVMYYKIIKKNNKNTYFRYKDHYLEISMPQRLKAENILTFVNNNFDQFYKKYEAHLKSIPSENEIILEEKSYNLIIKVGNPFKIEINERDVIVTTKLKDITKIKKKIYEYQLTLMLNKIDSAYKETLFKNKIKVLPLRLSHFKSKFGSYHRKNEEISLNIALAKANINYLYYVIMHEYAHTVEFNHSKKFYKVLEILMPNYKYYDKTIKKLSIWL